MSRFFLLLTAIVITCVGGNGFAQNNTPEAEYEKGNVSFDRKEWATANSHYDAALKLKADHIPSLLNRGRVAWFTGRYDQAITDLTKATELNPELAIARTWLAGANLDKGDHAAALSAASKAIELDAKQAFAWYLRGTAQIHKAEYAKAIDDLNEAVKLMPNDATVFNNRGIAWQKLGDEAKAKADFERRDALLPKPVELTAKQQAKAEMEAAKARFQKIDFSIKTMQNGRPRPVTRTGPQGVPMQVIPQVPQELLQMREDAWKAFLDASERYDKTK